MTDAFEIANLVSVKQMNFLVDLDAFEKRYASETNKGRKKNSVRFTPVDVADGEATTFDIFRSGVVLITGCDNTKGLCESGDFIAALLRHFRMKTEPASVDMKDGG